jgi:hypothetical protein
VFFEELRKHFKQAYGREEGLVVKGLYVKHVVFLNLLLLISFASSQFFDCFTNEFGLHDSLNFIFKQLIYDKILLQFLMIFLFLNFCSFLLYKLSLFKLFSVAKVLNVFLFSFVYFYYYIYSAAYVCCDMIVSFSEAHLVKDFFLSFVDQAFFYSQYVPWYIHSLYMLIFLSAIVSLCKFLILSNGSTE